MTHIRCFLFTALLLLGFAHADALLDSGARVTKIDDGGLTVDLSTVVKRGPFGEPLGSTEVKITPEVIAALTALEDLQRLNLSRVPLEKHSALLAAIPKMATLRELVIPMTGATDATLVALSAAKQLESIDLADCRAITDAGLKSLAALPNLKSLNLRSTQVTDAGLAHLKPSASLETLELVYTRVKGSGLDQLAALPKLNRLTLQADRSTADRNMLQLDAFGTGFAALKHLQIGGNHIDDRHLKAIVSLKQLEGLQLKTIGFLKITDTGLEGLAGLKQLKELNINGAVDVTDAGARHLSRMAKLEVLDLGRTKVGPQAVDALAALPKLRILKVVGSPFGPEGMELLKAKRPDVKVEAFQLMH